MIIRISHINTCEIAVNRRKHMSFHALNNYYRYCGCPECVCVFVVRSVGSARLESDNKDITHKYVRNSCQQA